ncbi:MAG: hypothetical protein R3E77_16760 [Steroidobacteraceae bacterium]
MDRAVPRFVVAVAVGTIVAWLLGFAYDRLFIVHLDAAWRPPAWTANFDEFGNLLPAILAGIAVGAIRPPLPLLAGATSALIPFAVSILSDIADNSWLFSSRFGLSLVLRDALLLGIAAVAGTTIRRLPNKSLERANES